MKKERLNTTISAELKNDLYESAEKNNRPLTDEVEILLRQALHSTNTRNLILLKVDDGLRAWLDAVHNIKFFGIDFNGTITFMLRDWIMRLIEYKGEPSVWFADIVDNLPEPYKTNLQQTRSYKISAHPMYYAEEKQSRPEQSEPFKKT